LGAICKDLGTAEYIVNAVEGIMSALLLPLVVFLVSAFIAFCTGTSWETMAITIPIAIPLAIAINVELPIVVASVLAGATMGITVVLFLIQLLCHQHFLVLTI